jgi:hypothetical protein
MLFVLKFIFGYFFLMVKNIIYKYVLNVLNFLLQEVNIIKSYCASDIQTKAHKAQSRILIYFLFLD